MPDAAEPFGVREIVWRILTYAGPAAWILAASVGLHGIDGTTATGAPCSMNSLRSIRYRFSL